LATTTATGSRRRQGLFVLDEFDQRNQQHQDDEGDEQREPVAANESQGPARRGGLFWTCRVV
jgi:hypothetical protein